MKTAIDLDDYAKVYGTYADAISVLTEPEFFRGSFERLAAVRERTTRPLLAKDFIVSDRQLLAAYRCGADAVIAEGCESGGHVGETTTMALVPQVVDAVEKMGEEIAQDLR